MAPGDVPDYIEAVSDDARTHNHRCPGYIAELLTVMSSVTSHYHDFFSASSNCYEDPRTHLKLERAFPIMIMFVSGHKVVMSCTSSSLGVIGVQGNAQLLPIIKDANEDGIKSIISADLENVGQGHFSEKVISHLLSDQFQPIFFQKS